jgi:hypothetical protein
MSSAGSGDEVLALLIDIGVPPHVAETYLPRLASSGFDSTKALELMTAEDMDILEIKEGHRRLITAYASKRKTREEISAPTIVAEDDIPRSPPGKKSSQKPCGSPAQTKWKRLATRRFDSVRLRHHVDGKEAVPSAIAGTRCARGDFCDRRHNAPDYHNM